MHALASTPDALALRLAAAEALNGELRRMCEAALRLHQSLGWDAVLATIREVVAELVGTDDFAVYEVDHAAKQLVPLVALGSREGVLGGPPLEAGPAGRAVACGALYLREGEEGPVACIPLRAEGKVRGLIAIYSLLPHRPALPGADPLLFDVLGTHAGAALYAARLSRPRH